MKWDEYQTLYLPIYYNHEKSQQSQTQYLGHEHEGIETLIPFLL